MKTTEILSRTRKTLDKMCEHHGWTYKIIKKYDETEQLLVRVDMNQLMGCEHYISYSDAVTALYDMSDLYTHCISMLHQPRTLQEIRKLTTKGGDDDEWTRLL